MPEIHMPAEDKDVPTSPLTAWGWRFGALVVLGALLVGSYVAGSQPNRRLTAFNEAVLADMERGLAMGHVVQPIESVASMVIFEDQTCMVMFVFDDTVLDEPQLHGLPGPPGVCQQLFESHFLPPSSR